MQVGRPTYPICFFYPIIYRLQILHFRKDVNAPIAHSLYVQNIRKVTQHRYFVAVPSTFSVGNQCFSMPVLSKYNNSHLTINDRKHIHKNGVTRKSTYEARSIDEILKVRIDAERTVMYVFIYLNLFTTHAVTL